MLITDLIHSCSNERVALAAMASIGGCFAERVRGAAQENGVPTGKFVAGIVRDFGRRANADMRRKLQKRVAGSDQPLLTALRDIVENAIESGTLFFEDPQCIEPRASACWMPMEAGTFH